MATHMAIAETISNWDCLTSETIPRTVAMAPGPNMIGMAKGYKRNVSFFLGRATAGTGDRCVCGRRRKKIEADAHEDNAADDTNHAQRNSENPKNKLAEEKKEKCQEHGVEARSAGKPKVFFFTL